MNLLDIFKFQMDKVLVAFLLYPIGRIIVITIFYFINLKKFLPRIILFIIFIILLFLINYIISSLIFWSCSLIKSRIKKRELTRKIIKRLLKKYKTPEIIIKESKKMISFFKEITKSLKRLNKEKLEKALILTKFLDHIVEDPRLFKKLQNKALRQHVILSKKEFSPAVAAYVIVKKYDKDIANLILKQEINYIYNLNREEKIIFYITKRFYKNRKITLEEWFRIYEKQQKSKIDNTIKKEIKRIEKELISKRIN